MEFREEVIRNPHYLHIRSSGVLKPKAALESCDRIARLLDETGHDLLLLDDRAIELETAPMFDYEQANYAARMLKHRCRRIALLGNPKYFEFDKFFETVCANRGLNLRHFLVEDEAIAWLLAAPEKPQPAACE